MVFILLIINNTHRLLLSPVPLKNDYEEYKKSNEILSELMKPDQKTMPIGINDFKSIVFENVSFENDGINIINDLSFEIKAKDIVLLRGKHGSGKSIIFKLLLGLLKPSKGNIYLDTVQMRIELGKEESHLFSFVPQDNLLYSASVLDNFHILTRVIDQEKIKDSFEFSWPKRF